MKINEKTKQEIKEFREDFRRMGLDLSNETDESLAATFAAADRDQEAEDEAQRAMGIEPARWPE